MAVDETTFNNPVTGQIDEDGDYWANFLNDALIGEDSVVDCEPATLNSVAADVLANYNIPYISGDSDGGPLKNIDIKRMDARTALNWSLMESSAQESRGGFYEPFIEEDGSVTFKQVGSFRGEITDIYYRVQTTSYVDAPPAVMVTGGRPLPKRKPLEWKPIWGESPASIYSMRDIFENCHKKAFNRYATIVFKDPNLDNSQYEDGIDNLYDITEENKYDRILGYVKYIKLPDEATKDTTVKYAAQTTIPIKVGETPGANGPYMGRLQDRPEWAESEEGELQRCFNNFGEEIEDPTVGVRVEIPEEFRFENRRGTSVDKFIGISSVYVVGREINLLALRPDPSIPESSKSAIRNNGIILEADAVVMASIDAPEEKTVRLEEGRHYTVGYVENEAEGESGSGYVQPYLIFAKDVKRQDPMPYGQGQEFYLDPWCEFRRTYYPGVVLPRLTGTILPVQRGKGILVEDIWAGVDMEIPCIVVEDPDGRNQKAIEIAKNLQYYVAPIVVEEYPNPTAFVEPGGTTAVNIEQPRYDKDPTTAEEFSPETSDFEAAMDLMQGNGMAITFSFLNDDDEDTRNSLVRNMAERIAYMMENNIIETVYTCGPSCNPKLGGTGIESGSVVNSIRYSYTDSGSYTISVTEGPKTAANLSQVDGGPTEYLSEDVSGRGTVIDLAGDNIHFKVRIDGFGERWAVNMTHEVIRIGDVVSCSIHNCPIER